MDKVTIDSFSKSFDNKLIVSGGNITLETGDIIGLFGRNGSGKSTILSMLFGAIPSDQIFFKHNEKVVLSRKKFKKVFSFSPQFIFLPNIKVQKLIKLFLENNIDEFINDDLLKEALNKKVFDLSFGTQKYLQTKLVLYNPTPFCLLDEPYNGLSPILIEHINELIKNRSPEKGILITDHDYQSLLGVSQKNYMLKNGTLFKLNSKEELVDYGYLNSL